MKALARAFRWKRMLDEGRYASISDIAAAEKIDRGYVGIILRLTLLAPDVVEAILGGSRLPELGLPRLLPLHWVEQRPEAVQIRGVAVLLTIAYTVRHRQASRGGAGRR